MRSLCVAFTVAIAACSSSETEDLEARLHADAGNRDAGTTDVGVRGDTGVDAGPFDAGNDGGLRDGAVACECIDVRAMQPSNLCDCGHGFWGCVANPQPVPSVCDLAPPCWQYSIDFETGCEKLTPEGLGNCPLSCHVQPDAG
jgi:hypothetical protein